jgi:hypothetical protein
MAGAGGLFGEGSTAKQLLVWAVLQQLISTAAQPAFNEIGKVVNTAAPTLPLDPAVAVELAARALDNTGDAQARAQESGIPGEDFASMVDAARHGPDLSAVMELLRRRKIGTGGDDPHVPSVSGALSDLGIRPEWHALITELATSIPDQAQVLNAWLEGQIEAGEAHDRLRLAGMAPDWIDTAYATNGQAPTPMELIEMWNRGLIPEGGTGQGAVSYDQGFLEGPWRNKWLHAFKGLREYFPPPRTVTAMYREGAFDHVQAADYLAKQGLPGHLITSYLSAGTHAKTAAEKHLAKGDVLALYHDKLIDSAQATSALVALKYTATDARQLLALTDVRAASAQLNSAITKVRELFLAGKLTEAQARTTLAELKVPAGQVAQVVAVWKLEAVKHVRTLTPAQIEDAFKLDLISQAVAEAELQRIGYTAFDAWLLLSIKHKSPLPGRPATDF